MIIFKFIKENKNYYNIKVKLKLKLKFKNELLKF